ncbi:MAG: hypothetical protein HLX52_01000 [Idiomarinaceae bacterium]|uniref:hypothetical protein n=1 Tax=Idiomarina sp. 28-8 TaxID=1260624 RepID=UPI00119CE507|nr:hypothetical protein [Idiomarina sp. 28-8]NWO01525.1 hypothetical protein [Idiomarinaceae bacterium]
MNDRLLPTSSMGIEMYNLVITLYNDDTLSRGGSDGDQRPTLRTFTLENPCFQELKPNQPKKPQDRFAPLLLDEREPLFLSLRYKRHYD